MRIRILLLCCALPLLSACAGMLIGGAAAGAGAAHDRRSFGSVIDDAAIEFIAHERLNHDKEIVLRNNVNLVSYNGVLLMIGEVASDELRTRAEAKITGISGVTRIVNELSVEEMANFGSRSRDKILVGQVKTALLDIVDIEGFDPTRVNVSVTRQIVYLMGLVTQAEAERVVEIARDVRGAKSVVKVFEYLD